MFRALGLLPGRSADLGALGALTGLPMREVRRAVTVLRRAHLAQESSPGWIAQHDVLRAYATEQSREEGPPDDRAESLERLLGYYVLGAARVVSLTHEVFVPNFEAEGVAPPDLSDAESAHDWMLRQAPNFVACAALPPGPTADRRLDELARVFGTYQLYTGLGSAGMTLLRRGLAGAQRLGNRLSVSRLERLLGGELGRSGEVEAGIQHLELSLETALEIGDWAGAAASLNDLGVIAGLGGRHAEALDRYTQSMRLQEEHAIDHQVSVTRVNRAETLVWLGRHSEALAIAEQVLRGRPASGASRARGGVSEAFALEVLARACLGLGDTGRARRLAAEGHHLAQQSQDRRRAAYLQIARGAIELHAADYERALGYFRNAADLATRETHPEIRLQALTGAARSAIALGSPDAHSYIEVGLGLAERLGLPAQVEELKSLLEPELSAGTAPAAGSC